MAARWWALQVSLVLGIVLGHVLVPLSAAQDATSQVYPATVSSDGTQLNFPTLPDACFDERGSIELVLWFDGVQQFDARDLDLGVNGERAEIPAYRWDLRSEWATLDGSPALVVRIGEGRFEEQHRFRRYAYDIQSQLGQLWISVHAPATVRQAQLVFTAQGALPRVVFDSSVPAADVFTSTQLTLQFHASGPIDHFECSLDGAAYTVCQSPVVYSSLAFHWHLFKVHAVTADGVIGPDYHRWFDVLSPRILLTSETPSANPTASNDMAIAFTIVKPLLGTATAQCQLDNLTYQTCQSPISYTGLSVGTHTVAIRRVTHLLWLSWDSLPSTYTWTIDQTPPVVQWTATPPALTNQSNATFQFQANQTGVTFECTLDTRPSETCTSPFALTGLGAGTYLLQVVGRTSSGLESQPLTYQWVIDQTPPVITLSVTPTQNPTNSTTLTASFTADKPATFTCALDTAVATECVSPLALTGLTQATHTLVVTATDQAGNVSVPAKYSWTVDLTLPTVSIVMTSPASSPTNQTTAAFTFTVSETASLSCTLDSGTAFACAGPLTLTGLAQGTHVLTVVATDEAGNVSTPVTASWQVDLTPPVVTLTSVDPSDSPTAVTSMEVDFSVSETAAVTCNRDNSGAVPCASPYVVNGLADGTHTIALQATDLAGNVSAVVSYQWVVASIATATLTNVTPPNTPTNSQTIAFEFTSAQSSQFVCSLDSAAATACNSPATYTGLAAGAHNFQVQAINAVGNAGPAATYSWTIDLTPPVITLGTITPSANPNASTTLQVAFTTSKTASVTCQLDSAAAAPCVSPYVSPALADGSHTLIFVATDAAGNVSTPVTYAWRIITSATVTLGTPTPSTSPVSNKTISIPFSSTQSTQFVCSLDGATAASCTSPATYSGLADGSHTFQVQALNPAGTAGPAASYTWVVDTTPPVLTLTSETPSINPNASTTLQVAFSTSETATVTCALDSGTNSACTSPYMVSGLASGSHRLVLVPTDTAGNVGSAVSYSWTVILVANVTLGTPTPSTSPVSSTAISIPFSSAQSNQFVCSLDGATVAACTSPAAYSGLANGSHTFQVQALNPAGSPGPAVSYTWVVDTVPPVITLTGEVPSGSPVATNSLQLSFSLSESATVTCQLDSGTSAPCTSPYSVSGLADGGHEISLQAIDAAGNVSATVSYSWTVITVAQVTLGTITPSGSPTDSTAISIAFSSTDATQFVCSLDGATAAACTSPASYTGLANGSHTFAVEALNPAGVAGPAATYSWTVDVTLPVVTLISETPSWSPTANQSESVSFSATASLPVTFSCSLDGVEAACTSPWSASALSNATHTLTIIATDTAGNTSAPATYQWVVNTAPLALSAVGFSNVTSTTAQISWTSSVPANSQMQYGTNGTFTQSSTVDPNFVTSHTETLTGLTPFTLYNVQAVSVDQDGRTATSSTITFRTTRD